MKMPPMMMHVRVKKSGSMSIDIWLPLFLVFLFVAAFMIALAPLALVAAIVLLPFGKARTLLIIPVLFWVCYTMKGLKVDVSGKKEKVLVSVI
jgi:hypothetical protein